MTLKNRYPDLFRKWDDLEQFQKMVHKDTRCKENIGVLRMLGGAWSLLGASIVISSFFYNVDYKTIMLDYTYSSLFWSMGYSSLFLGLVAFGCLWRQHWIWKKLRTNLVHPNVYLEEHNNWRKQVVWQLNDLCLSDLHALHNHPDVSHWVKDVLSEAIKTAEAKEFEEWKTQQSAPTIAVGSYHTMRL